MGKHKRGAPDRHKQGLGEQIEDPVANGVKVRTGRAAKRQRQRDDEEAHEQRQGKLLSSTMTNRILREARVQQDEVDAEEHGAPILTPMARYGALPTLHEGGSDDSDDDLDNVYQDDLADDWEADLADISPEDEAALAAFATPLDEHMPTQTLADVMLAKIRQRQAMLVPVPQREHEGPPTPSDIDPKVEEVYRQVGVLLSRYTSGQVPKALKIIPALSNWEEVLFLTDPENWSPHACLEATRIFVSNLNQKMAQRFLNLVLLPAVRNDIAEHKRLHFALFQALRKSTFKAGAFYKGVLLPLCASGTCTVREAVIVASVLKRTSIPVLHSAAALLRLADMPYNGINSFFMRVLLDKKYALPYRVIDALVDHFCAFKQEERHLPVVWHAALLCFVQRYKHEIRAEDKATLRALLQVHHHYKVSPEVLRELDLSRDRGQHATGTAQAATVPKLDMQVKENVGALPAVVLMEEY